MPFDPTTTLQLVEGYANRTGYLKHVQIGEPKGAIEGDLAAAVFMESMDVVEVTLTHPIELHVAVVRVYRNMLAEPAEEAETQISTAISQFLMALWADVTLGSTTRNIDVAGEYGAHVGAKWGYLDMNGIIHRVCDVRLPFIVDDATSPFAQ